jgi:hypothetical protein
MNYRNAILLYAYALPILAFVVGCGVVLLLLGRFSSAQGEKQLDFQQFTALTQEVLGMENQMSGKRELLQSWRAVLAREFRAHFNTVRGEVLKSFDARQLDITSESTPVGGGLAVTGSQKASRVQLEFRGGFQPMQEALLQIEGRLPQLQLESLAVQPDPAGAGLRYTLSYTAWEGAGQ